MMKRQEQIGAILLASGNSRRFGENKLLYPIEGKTMAEHGLELLVGAKVSKRVVVTQYERIEEIAGLLAVSSVRNENPGLGISHSIHLGIGALEEMDAWMFLVCDQPWLRAGSVNRLLAAYRQSDRGIAALSSGEKIGNPVIFSKKYKEELLSITGDRGGKKVLMKHREDTVLVEVQAQELEDVDVRRR